MENAEEEEEDTETAKVEGEEAGKETKVAEEEEKSDAEE